MWIEDDEGKFSFYRRNDDEIKEGLKKCKCNMERLMFWDDVGYELDYLDGLNDRKHRRYERRHPHDLSWLIDKQNRSENIKFKVPSAFIDTYNSESWIDEIYSKEPSDIQNLVEDTKIYHRIDSLKPKHKQILHKRVIYGYSSSEIAIELNCSDRNIRKHYEKIIKNLRISLKVVNAKEITEIA